MPISTFEHPRTTLYNTGIGGAGNYRRISYKELEPSPKAIDVYPQPRPFFGGRGGFGNSHGPSERTIFAFDEELARERMIREHAAPIYSIGRGGVGNYVPNDEADNQIDKKSIEDQMPPFLQASSRRTSTTSRSSSSSSISSTTAADRLVQKIKKYKK